MPKSSDQLGAVPPSGKDLSGFNIAIKGPLPTSSENLDAMPAAPSGYCDSHQLAGSPCPLTVEGPLVSLVSVVTVVEVPSPLSVVVDVPELEPVPVPVELPPVPALSGVPSACISPP